MTVVAGYRPMPRPAGLSGHPVGRTVVGHDDVVAVGEVDTVICRARLPGVDVDVEFDLFDRFEQPRDARSSCSASGSRRRGRSSGRGGGPRPLPASAGSAHATGRPRNRRPATEPGPHRSMPRGCGQSSRGRRVRGASRRPRVRASRSVGRPRTRPRTRLNDQSPSFVRYSSWFASSKQTKITRSTDVGVERTVSTATSTARSFG